MKFTKSQKQILFACVLAYTVAYMNRLNLSASLSSVMVRFSISDTQAGLLQSAFALVYASGQLINGAIVDRIRPVRHMMTGLVGLILCNLLMGFSRSYAMLLGLCLLNGAFQSMLWTPIVRLLALNFEGEGRSKANFLVSLTLIVGHLGAWGISGAMVELFGWSMSFIVPALVGIPCFLASWMLLRQVRNIGRAPAGQEKKGGASAQRTLPLFLRTGFFAILLSCVLYGFVRDGIVTWAPSMIFSMSEGRSPVLTSLLIPCINILGIAAAYVFNHKGIKNARHCIALMMGLSALFCLFLNLHPAALLAAILMGLACASMNGLNPLLTATIPMQYDAAGRIGLTAGLIDSFIYIGSALAGVLGGAISEHAGTGGLYLSWFVISLLAALLMGLAGSKKPMRALAAPSEK